jgi:hypothetical protein
MLSKQGILVQVLWMYCIKTNKFHWYQHHNLIRVLPEEPNINSRTSRYLIDFITCLLKVALKLFR